jgi:NADPH2:quinone reductase
LRAWQVSQFGRWRDTLELREVPRPTPEKDSALVRVRAAGINFPDLLVIEGAYQVRPPLPFTPGFEAVGEVVRVGADCKGIGVGDRVICWANIGSFREYITIRPEHTFHAPPAMTDAEAASFLVSYQTAYFSLVHRARLKAGEVLLVHAGAGSIGSAVIQLGKALGATVIATVSSPDKESVCRGLHADHTINYSTADFAEAVRAVTAGHGADVVIDPVGGEVFERSLKCIAWEGRIVPLGFTSGSIPSVGVNRVLLKNISVVGLFWSEYWERDLSLVRTAQEELHSLYERGMLRPLVRAVYEMEDLPRALAALQDRRNYGKSVVKMF